MRREGREGITRSEVTERIGVDEERMHEIGEDLEKEAADIERVRDTVANLEFSGTAEYVEALSRNMDEAEDETADAFDRDDEKLEAVHEESTERQDDLHERSDDTDRDRDRVNDASTTATTQETIRKLEEAKETVLEELDFCAESLERIRNTLDESTHQQQELERIVHQGGS